MRVVRIADEQLATVATFTTAPSSVALDPDGNIMNELKPSPIPPPWHDRWLCVGLVIFGFGVGLFARQLASGAKPLFSSLLVIAGLGLGPATWKQGEKFAGWRLYYMAGANGGGPRGSLHDCISFRWPLAFGRGYPESSTDALLQTSTCTRDALGRPFSETFHDQSQVAYGWDANSNMTSLTPSGSSAHTQETGSPVLLSCSAARGSDDIQHGRAFHGGAAGDAVVRRDLPDVEVLRQVA